MPWFRLAHFRYDGLIRHYQDRFGRERVLVEAYERFRDDPAAYVKRVCEFCGVASDAPLPFERALNPALGPVALSLQRRLNPFVVRDSLNGNSPLAIPGLRGPTRALLRGLDRITPANQKTLSWRPRIELFHYPLGAALILLIAYHAAMCLRAMLRRPSPAPAREAEA